MNECLQTRPGLDLQGQEQRQGQGVAPEGEGRAEPALAAGKTLPARQLWRELGWRLLPWLVPILLILGWQLGSSLGWINTRILPSPLQVLSSLFQLAGSGELWDNLQVSCFRAGTGFCIGGALGLSLGFATATSRRMETLLDSSLQMFRTIPHLALTPLVIIWFGIGEQAKIFLIVCGVMFPIYLNTFHGIRSVDRQLIDMARVYGLNRWELWRQIILPGALPSILVGVRFSLGVMWMTLIVAETIAASSGIGYMSTNAREMMQIDVMVLSILLYALLGKLADVFARGLERRWLKWKPEFLRATS
ncbi:MAG: ABC transporter permease subunit [Deltaproteobacteria bacterium]|jgi:ABC-type nitrate/sulfonate/bicarbonate transport system permease component|nr:ABC transporter permease subunit [Deltaproteobacteria bacterium]